VQEAAKIKPFEHPLVSKEYIMPKALPRKALISISSFNGASTGEQIERFSF
jgi:hypothetical protein